MPIECRYTPWVILETAASSRPNYGSICTQARAIHTLRESVRTERVHGHHMHRREVPSRVAYTAKPSRGTTAPRCCQVGGPP